MCNTAFGLKVARLSNGLKAQQPRAVGCASIGQVVASKVKEFEGENKARLAARFVGHHCPPSDRAHRALTNRAPSFQAIPTAKATSF